jgi:hypothetical protein
MRKTWNNWLRLRRRRPGLRAADTKNDNAAPP